jgi:hypothetical protein
MSMARPKKSKIVIKTMKKRGRPKKILNKPRIEERKQPPRAINPWTLEPLDSHEQDLMAKIKRFFDLFAEMETIIQESDDCTKYIFRTMMKNHLT